MSRISLAVAAVAVILTAMCASSLGVRAQGSQRFEYVRVTPYLARIPVGNGVQERIGYRACLARVNEWACQEFTPTEPSTEPLRNALVNLGNDGWELVSAVEEYPNFGTQFGANGLTYLFKRQMR
jgi:hypothetical protein